MRGLRGLAIALVYAAPKPIADQDGPLTLSSWEHKEAAPQLMSDGERRCRIAPIRPCCQAAEATGASGARGRKAKAPCGHSDQRLPDAKQETAALKSLATR